MDTPAPPKESSQARPLLAALSLVGELGFVIAVPLLVLVIIGVKLDRYFGTLPLCTISAMVLSMAISTVMVVQKIKKISI